jgi:hypothetical protein
MPYIDFNSLGYFLPSYEGFTQLAPPLNQTFGDFMQSFVAHNAPDEILNSNLDRFASLCTSFPDCRLQNPYLCANHFDTTWSNNRHRVFMWAAISVLTLRMFAHALKYLSCYRFASSKCTFNCVAPTGTLVGVAKVILIAMSVARGSLVGSSRFSEFMASSLMVPVLSYWLKKQPYWNSIIRHDSNHADHLRRLLYSCIFVKLPTTIISSYFFLLVSQVGLSAFGVISLVSGLLLVPFTLLRALISWRMSLVAAASPTAGAEPASLLLVAAENVMSGGGHGVIENDAEQELDINPVHDSVHPLFLDLSDNSLLALNVPEPGPFPNGRRSVASLSLLDEQTGANFSHYIAPIVALDRSRNRSTYSRRRSQAATDAAIDEQQNEHE